MNVFKTYDVRGVYPSEIDEKLFYRLGLVLKNLGYKEILVGRDARTSSESLHMAFCTGLINGGVNVIDVGVVTSPMLSFFCVKRKTKGGMITASHNPKEFNGLKFIDEYGIQLSYDSFLYKLEKINSKEDMAKHVSKVKGKISFLDITEDYVNYIREKFKNSFDKKLKVVFDCSNGVASIPLVLSLKGMNIESIIINKKPNGEFPNHPPNQTIKKNLVQLQESVKKNSADLGVIFDGDADRVGFVDNKGQIVSIDTIFILLAKNLIDKNIVKKPKILFDLRFSRYVYEFLELYGARPEIMRVGNPFYKKRMLKDNKILLSGELSGHIMFGENFGVDDSLFAALKVIEIVSHREKSLHDISMDYTKYYSSGELSIPALKPDKAIALVESFYKKDRIKKIDGLSVIRRRVWFNIRKSNTESLIRIVAEGFTKEEVEKEIVNIKDIIKND